MQPNRERIQMWADALRSGEYKQGTGTLKDEDGRYCCLGVACEISGLGEWDTARRYVISDGSMDGDYDIAFMPQSVAEWYGFENGNVRLDTVMGRPEFATTLNDAYRYNFKEIADAIERTFLT